MKAVRVNVLPWRLGPTGSASAALLRLILSWVRSAAYSFYLPRSFYVQCDHHNNRRLPERRICPNISLAHRIRAAGPFLPENSHFDLLDLLVYMKQYECKYSIVLGIYSWFWVSFSSISAFIPILSQFLSGERFLFLFVSFSCFFFLWDVFFSTNEASMLPRAFENASAAMLPHETL